MKEAEIAEKIRKEEWMKTYQCELGKIRGNECECEANAPLAKLGGCNHQFHRACIEGWWKITHNTASCPTEQDVIRCPRCRVESKIVGVEDSSSAMEVDVEPKECSSLMEM